MFIRSFLSWQERMERTASKSEPQVKRFVALADLFFFVAKVGTWKSQSRRGRLVLLPPTGPDGVCLIKRL